MPDVAAAPVSAEGIARLFHDTYERLAPEHGYETREASAVPWEDVPDANKSLMVAVAGHVLAALAGDPGVLPARMLTAIAGSSPRLRDAKGRPNRSAHEAAVAAMSVRWEHEAQLAGRWGDATRRAELAETRMERLKADLEDAYAERDEMWGRKAAALRERDEAKRQLAEAQRTVAAHERHINDMFEANRQVLQKAREQRDEAQDERDTLKAELGRAQGVIDDLRREVDDLTSENRQLRVERDALQSVVEWGREALEGAVSAWTTERDFHQERAGRKGYGHDEMAAEAYGAAIKAVTGILAALAAPETPGDAEPRPGWRERARARVGDQVAARMAELMAEPPLSAEEFDEAMRRNKVEAEAHLDRQSRGISDAAPDAPTGPVA
jgi:regulator of replication initiation timing